MAPVIPALIAGAVAGTTITAGSIALGFSIKYFAATLALSAAQRALAPDPSFPNLGSNGLAQSKTVSARASNSTRKLVYGEVRVGGTIIFLHTTDNDQFLHVVIVLAAHEIESFEEFYFADEELTLSGNDVTAPDKYNNLVKVYGVTKGTTGAIPAELRALGKWTVDHKLTDQAYIYARLTYNADAFEGGVPNISAVVRGRKVRDTRTGTTVFSQNPAMIIRNYLLDTEYGLGVSASEINTTSFETAANICDEDVAKAGGGTEKRYTFNGVVDTANTPRANLQEMLTSLNGSLYYSNGQWSLRAGAYVTPTVTLDESDLASGLIVNTANTSRESFNAIKGQIISPTSDWQATDYPAVTNASFQAADNNEQRFLNLDLPYTTSSATAQRIAKQVLFQNRQKITVQAKFKMSAFQFEVGDTVMITNSRFGWTDKVFEVASWRLNFSTSEVTVDCDLIETNSAVYSWSAEEDDFDSDDTDLPDPFTLPAPTITASDELELFNQQAISVLIADITSTSVYAYNFEVQAKLSTQSKYKSLGVGESERFTLVNVKAGATYDIRARIINAFGVKSPFATTQHTIVGQASNASDVTNFSVNIIGAVAELSWDAVTDSDLSHYVIRHSPLTSGATFNNAQRITKKVPRPTNTVTVPAKTGTYLIKAENKFGAQSATAATSVALVNQIDNSVVVDSVSEHPTFAGTKTDVVIIDDTLQLDTTNLFDSVAGNFDDASGLFDGGTGFIASTGTYDFANYIDLGSVFTPNVTATLKFTQLSTHLGTPAAGAVDVNLYISTTTDDPTGSPTWTAYRQFVVGTFTARALRFRAVLTSTDAQETPEISELTVVANLPIRTESDNDIVSGAGAKSVTFASPFKILRAVSISVGDMQSGDYYAITSKSATGFTITFYNSSNTAVSRTFDYVATGT